MKIKLDRKKKIGIFILINILFFVLLYFIYKYGVNNYESITLLNVPILMADSSYNADSSELVEHNSKLISTLQMRESLEVNSISSQNDGINQLRNIYIAIIAILLTYVISKGDKILPYIVILLIIGLFYGLEIHLGDLAKLSTGSKQLTSEELRKLVNQKSSENIWYNLNYVERDSIFLKIHDTRLPRKILAVFSTKDAVKGVLFVFPFFLVYCIFFYKSIKNYLSEKNKE